MAWSPDRVTSLAEGLHDARFLDMHSAGLIDGNDSLPDPDDTGPLPAPVTVYDYWENGLLKSVELKSFDGLAELSIGRITNYEYDAANRLTKLTLPDPDGVPSSGDEVTWEYAYWPHGLIKSIKDPKGNLASEITLTTHHYDAYLRLTDLYEPDPDGNAVATPNDRPRWQYRYYDNDLIREEEDPRDRVTQYEYDNLNRLKTLTEPDPDTNATNGNTPIWQYQYDGLDNQTKVIDPLGHETVYAFDARDRLKTITEPDPDGGGSKQPPVTTFTYDAAGNLKTLTDDSGNTTTWVYDALNRVIEEENEPGDSRHYQHDRLGNVVLLTDRLGRNTEYEYDQLDRLIEERWKDTSGTVVRTIGLGYDTPGNIVSVADPAATYAYVYDNLDRMTSMTQDLGGLDATIDLAHAYDSNSNRTLLTVGIDGVSDFVNDYQYDALNRMQSVQQHGAPGGHAVAEKFVEFDYFTDGQFQAINRYADLAGTQLVAGSTYGYDGNGRLTDLTHAKATNTIANYDWTYDNAHRITQFDSSVDGTTTYDYDNLDQLTGENHPGAPDDHTYAYDGTGNREDVDGTTWATGDANRLTDDGTFTYQYDAEGNLTKRTRKSGASADDYVTEYEWDHRNRLTDVTFKNNSLVVTKTVSYNYDDLNRRVHREVGSDDSYYVYDGTDVVLEFDGAEGDDVSHRYLHGPAVDQVLAGEEVGSLDTPGDVLWALSDNLGTVRDLVEYNAGTDTTTVANHLEYDAYGNIISETNAAVDFLYAFTGREWDAETQLQNNLNRWYDPTIGRWLSEDPIGFGASDANLYRYVSNSPSTASDPIGLEPITPQTRPWRYGALAQAQVGAWKGPFPSTTPGKVFVKPWSFLAELGDDQLDATKARGCYDLAGKRFGVFPTDAKGKITTTEYGQFPIHADGARVFSTIQGAFAYANQLVGDGKRARIYAAQMGAALKAAPTGWTPQYPQFGEVHRSQFRKVGFNFASLHWTPTQSWEWEWVSSGGRRGDPKRSAGLPNKTTTIFGVVEITPQREKVACGLPNTPWEQSTGQSKSPEWGRFHFLP